MKITNLILATTLTLGTSLLYAHSDTHEAWMDEEGAPVGKLKAVPPTVTPTSAQKLHEDWMVEDDMPVNSSAAQKNHVHTKQKHEAIEKQEKNHQSWMQEDDMPMN